MINHRLPWLRRRKKTDAELPLKPPIVVSAFSNGEVFFTPGPAERRVRQLILETAERGAKRHGIDRREFLASAMGMPAVYRMAVGTDVVDEAEGLCLRAGAEFPRATFFAGKLIFQRDSWWRRLLHNETPLALQKRLQWAGRTMVTMPIRVRAA